MFNAPPKIVCALSPNPQTPVVLSETPLQGLPQPGCTSKKMSAGQPSASLTGAMVQPSTQGTTNHAV